LSFTFLQFYTTLSAFVVPGIGIAPCAFIHAVATCALGHPLVLANSLYWLSQLVVLLEGDGLKSWIMMSYMPLRQIVILLGLSGLPTRFERTESNECDTQFVARVSSASLSESTPRELAQLGFDGWYTVTECTRRMVVALTSLSP
jgi:hypothetical protein